MIVSGYKSDRGLIREINEDSFYINDKAGVYVVADGMGGYEGGEMASSIAASKLGELISASLGDVQIKDIQTIVKIALYEANNELIQLKKEVFKLMKMGTTVVLSVFFGKVFYYSNLGDSRAYLYNKEDDLVQLTTDDSLVMEMAKRGVIRKDQLRTHPLRNIVTRYLGADELVFPDLLKHKVRTGDCVMLCTDGLTNMLDDAHISRLFESGISMGPQYVCNTLIDEANKSGGVDNITVIIIQNK